MDPLRLTLLAIGAAFIAILYLVLRIRSGRGLSWPGLPRFPRLTLLAVLARLRSRDANHAPDQIDARDSYYAELDDEDLQALSQMSWHARRDDDVDVSNLAGLSAVDDDEEGESLVIVLNVMAKSGQRFAGLDVLDALYANDLQHGEMLIFHRYPDQVASTRPIFSLANTVEPGTFDLNTIEQLQTPGLSLFMQLPGPMDSREAFELMLKTGRNLAEKLDGDLCDEQRNILTLQTIGHLKEQIESFLFRRKMAGLQKQRAKK